MFSSPSYYAFHIYVLRCKNSAKKRNGWRRKKGNNYCFCIIILLLFLTLTSQRKWDSKLQELFRVQKCWHSCMIEPSAFCISMEELDSVIVQVLYVYMLFVSGELNSCCINMQKCSRREVAPVNSPFCRYSWQSSSHHTYFGWHQLCSWPKWSET